MTREEATWETPLLNSVDTYEPEVIRTVDDDENQVFNTTAYIQQDLIHCGWEKFNEIFSATMHYLTTTEIVTYQQAQKGIKPVEIFHRDCMGYLQKFPEMSNANDLDVMLKHIDIAVFGFHKVQPLIDNPDTSDIKICAPDDVRVRVKGKAYQSNAHFLDENDLLRFVQGLALRNKISYDKEPVVTFTDDHDENYKLRFTVSLPIVNAVDYPYLHIRKIPKEKPDFDELIRRGMLDEKIKTYLIEQAKCAHGIVFAGPPGCVDCETEFFNGKEWKSIAEWDNEPVLQFDTDTDEASLVMPERYIKEPCDKMYHFETKYGINQTLSPEHRVLYYNRVKRNGQKRWDENVTEISAEELKELQNTGRFYGGFKTSFRYKGKGMSLSDIEIRLMLAVIADGTFDMRKDYYNRCTINIKKQRKKDELERILSEWGQPYKKQERDNGYTRYVFAAPRKEKEFTSDWYECSERQLQLICDNVLQWDGFVDKKGRRKFETTSKASAEFVQFAFSACGYRAVFYPQFRSGKDYKTGGKHYIRKSDTYCVIISDNTIVGMAWHNDGRDNNTVLEEVVPSDGYKYCFTVPTHALVLRRGGRIFITGNSGKTTALNAIIEYIPRTRETLVIQENDELFTNQSGFMFKHVTHGLQGEPRYTLEDLGRIALVEGCNQFIIGEAKGGEMRAIATLVNSGGYGMTTIHSNSAKEIPEKMADLIKYGSSYSYEEAKRMIKVFKVLIYMEDYKVREILEIDHYDEEKKDFVYRYIYRYGA